MLVCPSKQPDSFLCGQFSLFQGAKSFCVAGRRAPISQVWAKKENRGPGKKGAPPADLNRLREDLLKGPSSKNKRRERESNDEESVSGYAGRRGFDEDGGRQWEDRGSGYGGRGKLDRRDGNGYQPRGEEYGGGRENAQRAPYGTRRGGAGRGGRGRFSSEGRGSYGRGRGGSYREDNSRGASRFRAGENQSLVESRQERGYPDLGGQGRGDITPRGLMPRGDMAPRVLMPMVGKERGLDRRQIAPDLSDDEDEYEEDDSDYEEEDDQLPPDTFVMKDANGEEVVVFGHEALDPSMLTKEMLTWTPVDVRFSFQE